MTPEPGFDVYSPASIADRIEEVGVVKARLPLRSMIALGVLAGGFIGLGALFCMVVGASGGGRLLEGVAFSLGLVLVILAGAELFTGNNLLVMAWAAHRISTAELFRNWAVVLASNAVGASGLALIVVLSGHPEEAGIAERAVRIAAAKASLPFLQAFFQGVLCNVLVCLAVWLAMAGRGAADKILAIILPVSAFVAAGFEHSVANLYFLPLGLMLRDSAPGVVVPDLTWSSAAWSLVPVTLGNIVGGSVMVAAVYRMVYGRARTRAEEKP